MPRVRINKQKYMLNDLVKYIQDQMAAKRLSQADLAKSCGCTQQNMSHKLSTKNLYAKDLIAIFALIDAPAEDIAKLLKEG